MNTVVIDDDKKINMILDKAPPCLKRVVYIREARKETINRASSMGIEAIRFDQVEKIGSAHKNSYPEMVRLLLNTLLLPRPFLLIFHSPLTASTSR